MSLKQDEDEAVSPWCYACGRRQDIIVKVITDGAITVKTHNKMGNCYNVHCFRYTNLESMPSWKLDMTIPASTPPRMRKQ